MAVVVPRTSLVVAMSRLCRGLAVRRVVVSVLSRLVGRLLAIRTPPVLGVWSWTARVTR